MQKEDYLHHNRFRPGWIVAGWAAVVAVAATSTRPASGCHRDRAAADDDDVDEPNLADWRPAVAARPLPPMIDDDGVAVADRLLLPLLLVANDDYDYYGDDDDDDGGPDDR